MKPRRPKPPVRPRRRAGFTLIELLIAMGILGLFLTSAYFTLEMTLMAESQITEVSQSGKVGQVILTLLRRDLQSCAWRDLGDNVFMGIDQGTGDDAEDSMHFITFAPVPEPPEGMFDEWTGELASVGYVLKRGDGDQFILFRRVKWNLEDEPLDGGRYYPIYERVKGLSLRYSDGEDWQEEWDAAPLIDKWDVKQNRNDEPEESGFGGEEDVDDPNGDPPGIEEDDEIEDESEYTDDELDEQIYPLPQAISVELNIFIGDERGLFLDDQGEPIVETYTMVVPILAMERLLREDENDIERDSDDR